MSEQQVTMVRHRRVETGQTKKILFMGMLVARVIRPPERVQIWTMYQYIDALTAETPAGHPWSSAGERLRRAVSSSLKLLISANGQWIGICGDLCLIEAGI